MITDRNGVVLAQSYSAYTLEIQPARVKDLERDDRSRSAEIVDIQRARPQALPQAAGRVEELREPAAAHAPDRRRGGALRGQPLPLSWRRDQGAALPPVSVRRTRVARGRLHRAHQRPRPRAHRRMGRERELQGLRLHRQDRRRAVVRAGTARHDRRRGGRGRRGGARCAHAVAHRRRRRATICGCRSTSSCSEVAEAAFGDRRGALVAIEPATGDVLAFGLEAGVRSQSVRRGHRYGELGIAERFARQAAAQSAVARRLSAGLDDQAVSGAGGADIRQAHAAAVDLRSRVFFQLPGTSYRFRDDKPGGHGTVDMYKSIVAVLRYVLLRARERNRHR